MTTLTIIHIMLFLAVVAVSTLFPEKLDTKKSIIVISPVVIFSLLVSLNYQLPKLTYIPLAFMAGMILFVFSSWLTESNLLHALQGYIKNIKTVFRQNTHKFQDWNSLLYINLMILYEELIWRVFLVDMLSQYLAIIPVVFIAAILFYYSHPNLRNISLQALDLFLFGLILTVIYYYTRDYMLVVLIHFIRNIIITLNAIGENKIEKETNHSPR